MRPVVGGNREGRPPIQEGTPLCLGHEKGTGLLEQKKYPLGKLTGPKRSEGKKKAGVDGFRKEQVRKKKIPSHNSPRLLVTWVGGKKGANLCKPRASS